MAREMLDIGFDENGDDLWLNGDLSSVESTLEHQRQLLLNAPGAFTQSPSVGIGLENYFDDDEGAGSILEDIKSQFNRDGMEIEILNLNNLVAYYL
jgi:hypothetical protein